jgi:hypothetical protein
MRPIPLMLAVLLAAVPGLTATSEAGPKPEVPAAIPNGKPVSCIPLVGISDQRVRSDSVIDFTVGRQVYRNTLPMPCPQLGMEGRFLHETSLNEICSVDTITVLLDPGMMRGATCGLGQYQPVTMVKARK